MDCTPNDGRLLLLVIFVFIFIVALLPNKK